jgi:hypothetical protein
VQDFYYYLHVLTYPVALGKEWQYERKRQGAKLILQILLTAIY